MNQINSYCYEGTYLTPPMPFVTDAANLAITPDFSRPKSSPGILGHQADEYLFQNNPLRIRGDRDVLDAVSFPMSPFAPTRSIAPSPYHSTQSPTPSAYSTTFGVSPQVVSPRQVSGGSKKGPVPIAPHPVGLQRLKAQKRQREEDSPADQTTKRRRTSGTPHVAAIELSEEERLLLRLKDQENLAWKDIAAKFHAELGKPTQVPALQMRYKRLREKLRAWTPTDIQALVQAHEYWEKNKWEIISTKMIEFGSDERWPSRLCARKWDELNPEFDPPRDRKESVLGFSYSDRGSPDPGSTPAMAPLHS